MTTTFFDKLHNTRHDSVIHHLANLFTMLKTMVLKIQTLLQTLYTKFTVNTPLGGF